MISGTISALYLLYTMNRRQIPSCNRSLDNASNFLSICKQLQEMQFQYEHVKNVLLSLFIACKKISRYIICTLKYKLHIYLLSNSLLNSQFKRPFANKLDKSNEGVLIWEREKNDKNIFTVTVWPRIILIKVRKPRQRLVQHYR